MTAHRIIEPNSLVMDELRRRAPGFPEGAFIRAVSAYAAARTPEPSPAVVRDELDEIAERAIELAAMLGDRSDRLAQYLEQREAQHGASGLTARLTNDLRHLMGLAEMARRDAEVVATPGRALSPRTKLVDDLAGALRGEGLEVSARAQDRLVNAFAIALRAVGESIADAQGSVKSALRTIQRNNGAG